MENNPPRMVQHNVYVDPAKYDKLRELSAARRVPMGVLIREGLARVLDLAEKQQDTAERCLKRKG